MKNNLNTIFVGFFFMIYMIFSALLFIPLLILSIPGLESASERFTHWTTSTWGHFVFAINRSKMHVTGRENLPKHKKIIYIGNHQGYADIPFLMANLPTTIGFIAKKELGRVPVIGLWMKGIHCIFLDRGNFRKAMRGIEKGIREAHDGHPKVIFPEGTRSQGEKMGSFKPGSILLAAKAGLTIVPVTINGTYKLWEEHKRIVPAELQLTIHPSIETEGLNEEEQKILTQQLWDTIASALPDKGA